MKRLIVTDLDGTLIDHDTYAADLARPALDEARRLGVPVVLCSSKTRAEMSALARALALTPAPLIVENGGAVWFPGGWPNLPTDAVTAEDGGHLVVLGAPASVLQPLLTTLAVTTQTRLRGFSSMTDDEVARRTGLAPEVAALARQREYSEPFVCLEGESDLSRFDAAARDAGARVTRGGRFFHLVGDADKGRAARLVRATCPTLQRVVGLGDAPNDIALLQATDDAIIVPQPSGVHAAVAAALPGALRAPAPGPAGWNTAVLEWLARSAAGA